MRRPAGAPPLIIITSNVERQLPDAFLRRCVFWHIEFPRDLLPDILDEHCPEASGSLRGRAVAVFNRLRAAPGLSRRPGTAELIDWVNALSRVYQRAHAEAQLEKVAQLLDAGGRGVPWLDLPALGCLVKLREDREALARA